MTGFGTYGATDRVPAEPMAPIIDPARWEPEELVATDDWLYHFSAEDILEIYAAVETVQRSGTAIVHMSRQDFPLPNLVEIMADVRQELLEGRGLVFLRGLPVADLGRERAAIAYFGIGCHLGVPISQNAYGHLLGHVRDFGKSFDDPKIRGYRSKAALGFHADEPQQEEPAGRHVVAPEVQHRRAAGDLGGGGVDSGHGSSERPIGDPAPRVEPT